MNSRISYIIFFVLAFLLQLAICDYLNLGPFIYVCLIPLLIIILPRQIHPNFVMLIAFGLGILLDIFSDGVLGMNAAAAILTAALKTPLYKMIVNGDRQDKTIFPSIHIVGFSVYLKYLAILIAIYLVTYVSIDCMGIRSLVFVLAKIAVSIVVNVALSLIISLSLLNRN